MFGLSYNFALVILNILDKIRSKKVKLLFDKNGRYIIKLYLYYLHNKVTVSLAVNNVTIEQCFHSIESLRLDVTVSFTPNSEP